MKSKSTRYGDKKMKGFYTALAAGGGAVLVLALVVSLSNMTTTGPDPQQLAYDLEGHEETVMAGADYTLPYLAQTDMDQAIFRPRNTPSPGPGAPAGTTPRGAPTPAPEAAPGEPAGTIPRQVPATPVPEAAPRREPTTERTPNVAPNGAPSQPAQEPANESAEAPAQPVAVFEPFTEDNQMVWPVYGDIAMIFSQDRLIYNPTLDQWRTNDDLRISAQEGTPVRAAACGKVVEVGNDRVYGNFVRIDNGNGWETIFGQLMDGILVVEGDIVQAGQVIGGVGRPSVFSVLDGHHVSLRVLHEDNLMDPKMLLADIQE